MRYPRLTFANVISCLALFVALGGASYAAVSLPMNSVGTKQIKSGAIDNSKIKSGSLRASAFKAGQLVRGKQGKVGKVGLAGAAGTGIKLAADVHYMGGDIPGDNQWHDYAHFSFTATANTIYMPTNVSDYTGYSTTGPTCTGGVGVMSRVLVNGANTTKVEGSGLYSYTPQVYGPYPAGTAITMQFQYLNDCNTQAFTIPAGEQMLIPYATA